jgi:Fibronectin type III domain
VRGVNAAGTGPWSPESFSATTSPDVPGKPEPPEVIEKTMSTLTFRWSSPHDGGSAITGFSVEEDETGLVTEHGRSATTHTCRYLISGRPHRIRLRAKNVAGYSEYSEWTDAEQSITLSDKPENPSGLSAVAGTWNSITLTGRLPFDNGNSIRLMLVQKRSVDAYTKSSWSVPVLFEVPKDITIIEQVDFSEMLLRIQAELILKNAGMTVDGIYDPFTLKKAARLKPKAERSIMRVSEKSMTSGQVKVGTSLDDAFDAAKRLRLAEKRAKTDEKRVHTGESDSDDDEDALLDDHKHYDRAGRRRKKSLGVNMQEKNHLLTKPEGSLVQVTMRDLLPNTIYEFRVSYKNNNGATEYSIPCRRAKTNHAKPPAAGAAPTILEVSAESVVIILDLPDPGCEPITHFEVESKDVQKGFTREEIFEYHPKRFEDKSGMELNERAIEKLRQQALTVHINNLVPMTYYQFRAKAVNMCGAGQPSDYTEPLRLPALDNKEVARRAMATANASNKEL